MGSVGLRVRWWWWWWWCVFFAMAITTAAAARNSILLSEKAEVTVVMGREMEEGHEVHGRSLKVRLNDYNDPSANHGHDPKNRGGGGGHKGGGRGSNDTTP